MPSRHYRNHAFATARTAWRLTEKVATGLARWATTDHTGTAKLLVTLPPLGFVDTVCMVLIQLFFGILGAIGSAIMIVLLFTYGIPLLLFM